MAASVTIVPMAHERKAENLRAFMVNLANSRGFSLPETKLFEQRLLDLCFSPTPDHPTYSAMIFIAITDLNEEGGSCEESISEFIKSKYKNLPFAHTSLLSLHLAKLVNKREILCDENNYCYTLPGVKKQSDASTDDQRAVNEVEVMTRQNEEESVRILKSGNCMVDLLEERTLTESETNPKGKACAEINAIVIRQTEDNVVVESLKNSTAETLREERVATEQEVAIEKSETECRTVLNSGGVDFYEVVVLDEQNDVVMEESGRAEEKLIEIVSQQRNAKWRRTSDPMKESCVVAKREAFKTLCECQYKACDNIIALAEMLKQCREKDQQNNAVSEIDDVSRLPLSMESCKELRKFAQKIESQLSEIVDTFDEVVVPCDESQGCETQGIISEELFKEDPKMKTPCGNNGSEKISKQIERKKRETTDPQEKPKAKKTRVKRLRDIGTTVLRKSPRVHKPI